MILDQSSVPSFYVNGTFIGSFSGTNTNTPTTSMFLARNFGDEPEGVSARAFNGKISNAFFYNRVLSASEIQQNFQALRGRYGI
jgi:hypothetical protein